MQKPIDPETIAKNSDLAFYSAVATVFEGDGWEVDIRPHYTEVITEHTREVTLFARRLIVPAANSQNFYQTLAISCGNLTNDVVFLADDIKKSRILVSNHGQYIRSVLSMPGGGEIDHQILLEYQWETVAKIFASGSTDDQSPQGEEPVYSAIGESINALILERHRFRHGESLYHALAVFRGDNTDGGVYDFFNSADITEPVGELCADIMYSYYPSRNTQDRQENERFHVILAKEGHLDTIVQRLNRERNHIEKVSRSNKERRDTSKGKSSRPVYIGRRI